MKKYDPKSIESKWQKSWEKAGISRAKGRGKKWYSLIEFPYPSGEGLHVGHVRSNTAMDVVSRKRRMQGYDVLYPIGWDAFGLPTENYALKTGVSPEVATKKNTDTFRRQLKALGFSFDWSREVNTTDPSYYKWTQWMFLQFFKKGLAYKTAMPINWCPKDKIGLANEEAAGGVCDRCGGPVEKRMKEQWMLRITAYADKLLEGLGALDYIPQAKVQQENWIGRSEGAEIDFEVKTKANYVLLHGYKGAPDKNFLPWLRRELVARGRSVQVPALPETDAPDILRQVAHVEETVRFDEQTVIVAHSLGSVVALKAIERLERPIKKLVLAAGFMTPPSKRGEESVRRNYEKTFDWQFDVEAIRRNAGEVVILRDTSDKNIPAAEADKLQTIFGGRIVDFTAKEPHICGNQEPEVLAASLDALTIFTTRPDTLFGATYMVVAPEHALVAAVLSGLPNRSEVERYVSAAKAKSETERTAEDKKKTGVALLGVRAVNPATGEDIPVWVADYVLGGYGTGAIMAVPAHDARDFAFAHAYDLPIRKVVTGPSGDHEADHVGGPDVLYDGEGVLIDSGRFTGMYSEKAKPEIVKDVRGRARVQYRLRDWVFSRQRYWGEPIPLVNCEKCGWVLVPEKDLPVTLPKVKNYEPRDDGQSPLASVESWVRTKCPTCKGPARRETDTMPNWAGSSWYFLRYTDPKNKKTFADPKKLKYFMPVDWYNGGMEHTVLHLLYSRFWNYFLYDIGVVPAPEPYRKRTSHGMVLAEGGVKMSKSKGNVINPDDIVKQYGADTLRLYEMFMGPFDQTIAWDTRNIVGVYRFLERVWKTAESVSARGSDKELEAAVTRLVKKAGEDIETMSFNTALSAMMIFINECAAKSAVPLSVWKRFLLVLAPFAPHIAEELWQEVLGNKKSIHLEKWPKYDPKLLVAETFTLVIQVNGKLRDSMEVATDITEADASSFALHREKIAALLHGAVPKKIIYVPGRLVNIVV